MKFVTTLLAVACIAGCAGPQTAGEFHTKASYDRLYAAAMRAVPVVGFSVTSANHADGLIVAQQGVLLGRGSAVGLNAIVANEGTERVLRISFVAPPGTLALGNFDQNVVQYIAAVRAGVPDLHAAAQ